MLNSTRYYRAALRCSLYWVLGIHIAEVVLAQSYYIPYTFTTLAGLSRVGSQDGPASVARFYVPTGVAVDSAGNLYVADELNRTVRKITPAEFVSTLAGLARTSGNADGPGSAARFNRPSGVAVDSRGNVYVADTWNDAIRKISPAGVVSTLAGSAGNSGSTDGTGTDARFDSPYGVTLDSAGNVYVADTHNETIRKITPGGVVSTLAGSPGIVGNTDGTLSMARFNAPRGSAVDSAGDLYVVDTGNAVIRKIAPTGQVSTFAGPLQSRGSTDGIGTAARFFFPAGIAVDGVGSLYLADYWNYTVRKITPGGVVSTLAGLAGSSGSADGPGSAARFNGPTGVAVDSAGNIYVADELNRTVRKITPGGVVSTLAGLAGSSGSTDGIGSGARFTDPFDVAVDYAGNVYVVDTSNFLIRKITPDGVVSTLAGSVGLFGGSADGPGNAARFFVPKGVAVDNAGNIYVADSGNDTIRRISRDGFVNTVAGLAGSGGSADGTGNAARFYGPRRVAVDSAGNLYVSDDTTIRKGFPAATPTGVTILIQPQSQTVLTGNSVTFNVAARGAPPLTYQWRKDGVNLPGATNASYTISNTQTNHSGTYSVVVGNALGSVTSSNAVLTVIGSQGPQDITWLSPTLTALLPNVPYPLEARASSGLPITFQVVSGPAVISGSTITLTNVGSAIVLAQQTGSAIYSAATYARLLEAFRPAISGDVRVMLPLPDGKVLLGGSFTNIDGVTRRGIARLNADDSLDLSFQPDPNLSGRVFAMALQPDGKVMIDNPSAASPTMRYGIVRLREDGSLDNSFRGLPTGQNAYSTATESISSITLLPDGMPLMTGFFRSSFAGFTHSVAFLNTDGSFFAPVNMFGRVAVVQFDGKFVLAGSGISRFLDDGQQDLGFKNDVVISGGARALAMVLQPDGKVLVGGGFTNVSGVARNRLARLNPDGTVDAGFDPERGADRDVLTLALQADGRVILGGLFTNVNGVVRNRLARLNSNGSLDESFNPGSGANSTVYSVATLPDGQVFAGGSFTAFDGKPASRYVRLRTAIDAVPEQVSFGSGLYIVDEGATNALVAVKRTGRGQGAVAVDYTVSPGTAAEGRDFRAQSGTVRFADGDMADKMISIPLTAENSTPRDDRTVLLTLRNAQGAQLPPDRAVATVRLRDNDTGLLAAYFSESSSSQFPTFADFKLVRRDPHVAFDWGRSSPDSQVAEEFSVVWKGSLTPEFSEDYTFYTLSDDGVRLWIDGKIVIDDWTTHPANSEVQGILRLQAGRAYEFEMHYFDSLLEGMVRLAWSSASQPKQIIPESRFLPATSIFADSALPPRIGLSTNRISRTLIEGLVGTRGFSLWNEGGQPLTYTVSTDASWLSVASSWRSGTVVSPFARVPVRPTAIVSLSFDSSQLPLGPHRGHIMINGNFNDSPSVIDVTFDVLERGPLDEWHVRNPWPQGNTLNAVVFGKDQFIGVGRSGTIVTSPDGLSWTVRKSGTTSWLEGIGGGDSLVAVGDSGTILTSSDAAVWTSQASGVSGDLYDVVEVNGNYVAVGNPGTILTSTNRTLWTKRSSGVSTWLYGVAHGNGTFMTVGQSGTILTSPDGTVWTPQSSGVSVWLLDIAFGNGSFVVVGESGTILTSADGRVWTKRTSGVITSLYGLAYGIGRFVAVGSSGIVLPSLDGVVWTKQLSKTSGGLWNVAYGQGKFVAVGNSGTILTSTNSSDWTQRNYSVTTNSLERVTFGNGTFAAVGGVGTIVTSPEGAAWTQRSSGVTNGLRNIGFGNNIFLATGDSGTLLTSDNAIAWTKRSSGSSNSLTGVTFGKGTFAVVGGAGTILTSRDGASWSLQTSGTTVAMSAVAFGNETFVAIGASGTILTSTNSVNWTPRVSETSENLQLITFGNGRFVVKAASGRVFISSDGVNWTPFGALLFSSASDMVYSDLGFVAVGGYDSVDSSYDGSSWITHPLGLPVSFLRGITFANNTFVAVGGNGTILETSLGATPRPSILQQPADAVVTAGSTVAFQVGIADLQPLSYQWRFNGSDLAGATNATLTLSNAQQASAAFYSVTVSNAFGTTTSFDALLKVQATSGPHFESATILPNGSFRVRLSNASAPRYVIQASTDLRNWSPVSTNDVRNGELEWIDSAVTTLPFRFYRAFSQ